MGVAQVRSGCSSDGKWVVFSLNTHELDFLLFKLDAWCSFIINKVGVTIYSLLATCLSP